MRNVLGKSKLPVLAALFGALLASSQDLSAQGQPATRPPIVIPPGINFQAAPRTAPTNQDAFNALIGSAASIDMDAPVAARAEFEPATVPLGGRAIYRIVLTALDESVKVPESLPSPNGLRLQAGGRGQAYQPVGGQKLQPQTTILFHTTATSTGTFVMPTFPVTVYGKQVMIPEARLSVTAPGVPGVREALRLLVELPEEKVYVGQTIKLRVILLDPGDGSVQGLSQPHITGDSIFSEPISFARRDTIRRNGQTYPAFVSEVVITLMREGEQQLVAQAQGMSTRIIQGQAGVFQSFTSLIDSDPVTVNVHPLPKETRLPGFTGAIGTFQLDPPKLSTNEVRAGDPIMLTVTLHGDGNIGRLTLPQLPFLRDWQTFPPVGDTSPSYAILQRGYTMFSYTLIPLSDASKATPAIPFSYFEPKQGNYVDLTIPPVPLSIKPAPPGAVARAQVQPPGFNSVSPDDSSGHEKELVLNGLLEARGAGVHSLRAVQERGWFIALQFLPAFTLAGLWGWDRRKRYLEQHPEVIRKRRAQRGLRRQLRMARRASAARDATGFVHGAINALREACAPHVAANPEALVCADVLQELPPPARLGSTGQVVRRLFAAADATRFGGAAKDGADLLALQPEVEQLISQLRARL